MRSSASKYFAVVGVFSLFACSSSDDGGGSTYMAPTGGTTNTPTGGTSATGGSTTGGAANGGATTGGAGGAGGAATDGGAGGAATGGGGAGGAAGGTAGAGGAAVGGAITAVQPSTACGVAIAPDDGTYNIEVSGQKTDCAREGCGGLPDGVWTDSREYSIYKPSTYTNATPYTLVFLGPGCGGGSTNIYPYDNNANNTIIRIGVKPSSNSQIQTSHGTNQNQGCFDDKEGDDSVDFVLYEDLWDLLDTQLCFDKNRVFFGGDSSGAWWSNEHGCHYAGDPVRPVRGIIPNTGGLPDQEQFKPTCTTSGMAGMWIHERDDNVNPFTGNVYAINRAMTVNGCTAGQTFDTATFENYPIGGGQGDDVCKRITGCDPLYPLVVCLLNGNQHGSHPETVNPGASTFLQSFLAAPLAP